jgi:hypothetical protein
MTTDRRDLEVESASTSRSLDPIDVAARLRVLRRIARVERDAEARTRLVRERPERQLPFETAVHRRLRELRALCTLTNHLHRIGRGPNQP